MSEIYNPPVGFHFKLSITGQTLKSAAVFQEVSGISIERKSAKVTEGENRFAYRVPGRTVYENVVLKRGLIGQDSAIAKWCMNTFDGGLGRSIETKTIDIGLFDVNTPENEPIMSWQFVNAYPLKWEISRLDSMNNELVIEILELTYSYFSIVKRE